MGRCELVVDEAKAIWARPIDGTTMAGRTFIGNSIIGNEPQWTRHTGSAWCGYFARYIYNRCGMPWILANQFSSWYRAVNLFGKYRDDKNLKPPTKVEFEDGRILPIRDWHEDQGEPRICLQVRSNVCPLGYNWQPGDMLVRARRLTSWHGHVMLLSSVEDGTLHTIEGNATGVLGSGQKGYGVVKCKRTWKDVDYVVRASALDFRGDVRYTR